MTQVDASACTDTAGAGLARAATASRSSDASFPAWSAVVNALPIPAALVDRAGGVLVANRWLEVEVGSPLVRALDAQVAPGLTVGHDDDSRWRVRPLDDDEQTFLATREREDVGDHLLRQFFSSGDALYVVYDQWGRVVQSNRAWEVLLGYTSEEVFGLDSWTLLPPDDLETRARVEEELRSRGRSEPTVLMRRKDGEYRRVQWNLHFDTSVGRCFGMGRDVTDEETATADLHRRAYTDELTGLANRAALLERLAELLDAGHRPAVLFCDLDRFKVVNDSLGHRAGDQLLAKLGHRLTAMAVSDDSLAARLGGDEFVAILGDSDVGRAVAAAQEIQAGMTEPFVVSGRAVHIGMSVGIALAHPGVTAEDLLGEADTAAYQAKQGLRGGYVVFDEDLREFVDRRFNVEAGLRRALESGGIETWFQPIVAVDSGLVRGVEALVRWRRPEGRIAAPGEFLDVAEDAGLMPVIGLTVARDALELGARYQAAGHPITISINVSSAELATADFGSEFLALVAASGLDPKWVLVEITESAVLATHAALPNLRLLRDAGARVALDDFGTGFSSLAHLRELPIDVVKVDRTFIRDLVADDVTRAVTSSVVDLCHALGLGVVLEGIETVDQWEVARSLRAHRAQGYLFHRPIPERELDAVLGFGRGCPAISADVMGRRRVDEPDELTRLLGSGLAAGARLDP